MCGVRGALCVVVLLAGCVRDELVDCGNGVACPARTACAWIADDVYCVAPADLDACLDHDPFAECQRADGTTGACYTATPAGVCLPAGCGNGLIDPGEVCDDRNGVVGDGCSANCLSNETCGNGVVDPVGGEQCDDGNLLGHDGCASGCRPESAQWELVTIGLPTGVFSQALAYDTARHRLVRFGGAIQNGNGIQVARDETWEWDGVAWTRIPTPIAPSARFDHVLAYDPVRRKTVLFGGASSGLPIGADTWEWDGNTWTYRPMAVSPAPRYGAAATWDPERQRIVLFGGSTGTSVLGDLWEWDGTNWTQVAQTVPPPRTKHAMAYDPSRGVMVIAGGRVATGEVGETWERHGGVWTMIAPTPAELDEPELAFDGVGLVAFGGRLAGVSTGNTWRWDGQAWSNVAPADTKTPPLRSQAGLARDWTTGQLVLLGGHFESTCMGCSATRTDVWTWNAVAAKWTEVAALAPTGRALHGAVFDALRGVMVMFGGGPSFGTTLATAETWELRDGHWWQYVGPGPSSRNGPGFAFDAAHGESVLFGGRSSSNLAAGRHLAVERRTVGPSVACVATHGARPGRDGLRSGPQARGPVQWSRWRSGDR
ncbi:MAG: hypothetical protein IPQ07_38235 [Myxococcales bacterium]|nr:hypothetical protein [Myxococcales bacterium]